MSFLPMEPSSNASAAQNQKAINKLIALVSKKGGGKVVIPKGTWNTGAIEMKSHVDLVSRRGCHPALCLRTKALSTGTHLLGRLGLLELLSMHLCLQGYRHRHYR